MDETRSGGLLQGSGQNGACSCDGVCGRSAGRGDGQVL